MGTVCSSKKNNPKRNVDDASAVKKRLTQDDDPMAYENDASRNNEVPASTTKQKEEYAENTGNAGHTTKAIEKESDEQIQKRPNEISIHRHPPKVSKASKGAAGGTASHAHGSHAAPPSQLPRIISSQVLGSEDLVITRAAADSVDSTILFENEKMQRNITKNRQQHQQQQQQNSHYRKISNTGDGRDDSQSIQTPVPTHGRESFSDVTVSRLNTFEENRFVDHELVQSQDTGRIFMSPDELQSLNSSNGTSGTSNRFPPHEFDEKNRRNLISNTNSNSNTHSRSFSNLDEHGNLRLSNDAGASNLSVIEPNRMSRDRNLSLISNGTTGTNATNATNTTNNSDKTRKTTGRYSNTNRLSVQSGGRNSNISNGGGRYGAGGDSVVSITSQDSILFEWGGENNKNTPKPHDRNDRASSPTDNNNNNNNNRNGRNGQKRSNKDRRQITAIMQARQEYASKMIANQKSDSFGN